MIIRFVPRGRWKGDVITEEAGEVMIEKIGVMQGRGPEPEMQVASKGQKRLGGQSPLETPEGTSSATILTFSQ